MHKYFWLLLVVASIVVVWLTQGWGVGVIVTLIAFATFVATLLSIGQERAEAKAYDENVLEKYESDLDGYDSITLLVYNTSPRSKAHQDAVQQLFDHRAETRQEHGLSA